MPNRTPKPQPRPASANPPEIVDPRWIISALGGMLVVCIICAYIAVCALFSYGQWQLVLHPSRTVIQTPTSLGLNFAEVHFAPDATGQPQLYGWWIPSDLATDPTVLLLHSGDGSITDALPASRTLHDARLNVLLFDYRGYGRSGGKHPTQALMQADAASALNYLTTIRSVAPASLIVYGSGVGASLAVKLASDHKDLAALILQSPDGDFQARVIADPRSRMAPVRLLFHEDFPLAAPLRTLQTPKLLITDTPSQPPTALQQAATPKTTLELTTPPDQAALHTAIRRFLDTYLPQHPATLTPTI